MFRDRIVGQTPSCALGVVASLFLGTAAFATTFSGTISGTAHWTVSPGGGACDFAWRANWTIDLTNNRMTLSHTVRLNTADGSAAPTNAEMTAWETQIESLWNRNDIAILRRNNNTGEVKTWNLRYDITFVTTGTTQDYKVTIHDGTGGTNTSDWYRDGGSGVNTANLNVAAHEVGHFLANPDEYTNGGCIIVGSPHNAPAFTTNSLMNNTRASTHPDAPPHGVTHPRHYHLWQTAFMAFDTAKGLTGYKYTIIPTPGAAATFLAALGLLAIRRRRAA
jgi:hypothetical protein